MLVIGPVSAPSGNGDRPGVEIAPASPTGPALALVPALAIGLSSVAVIAPDRQPSDHWRRKRNNIVNRPGGNNNFVNININRPGWGLGDAGHGHWADIGTTITFRRTIMAGITAVGAGTGATTGMRRSLPARRPGV